METAPDTSVIAIDGGGTRCRMVLDSPRGQWRVELGAANVFSDFDTAIDRIADGLGGLAARAGLAPSDLTDIPTYAGLAGVTGPDKAAQVADALPLSRLLVENDRLAALQGALGDADGAVAHCGTGSFLILRRGAAIRWAGGWGPRLGDQASAYAVGKAAMVATLDAGDGLIAAGDMTAAIAAKLGTAADIVRIADTARPGDIADLAPLVTAAAQAGDPVAVSILTAEVAEMLRRLGQLGWTSDRALCLTGGLGPHLAPYLPDAARAALTGPKAEPIDGALQLAHRFREGGAP